MRGFGKEFQIVYTWAEKYGFLSTGLEYGGMLNPFHSASYRSHLNMRRDVRAVEGARLESVCTGNCTEGSNPSLSAIIKSN